MDDIEMRAHFQGIKESLRVFGLASSGMSVMALVVGFLGIVLACEWSHLLPTALNLLISAAIYNVGICIYVICRWIARKRATKR